MKTSSLSVYTILFFPIPKLTPPELILEKKLLKPSKIDLSIIKNKSRSYHRSKKYVSSRKKKY